MSLTTITNIFFFAINFYAKYFNVLQLLIIILPMSKFTSLLLVKKLVQSEKFYLG